LSDLEADLDNLIATGKTGYFTCPVVRVIEDVENGSGTDAAAKVKKLANDKDYSASRLTDLLHKHGYRISKESIRKHRDKGCVCK
jgi:repressor of nif and glnA expression